MFRVAMTLRLSEEESQQLRARAAAEGISMQEVAKKAIAEYLAHRNSKLMNAIEDVVQNDAELLRRLSQ